MRDPADLDIQTKAIQDGEKSLTDPYKIQICDLVPATGVRALAPKRMAGVLPAAVE